MSCHRTASTTAGRPIGWTPRTRAKNEDVTGAGAGQVPAASATRGITATIPAPTIPQPIPCDTRLDSMSTSMGRWNRAGYPAAPERRPTAAGAPGCRAGHGVSRTQDSGRTPRPGGLFGPGVGGGQVQEGGAEADGQDDHRRSGRYPHGATVLKVVHLRDV